MYDDVFLSEEEIENVVIKALQDNFEREYNNGKLIDWNYWAELNNITSAQAARLINLISPRVWPDDKCSIGDISKDLKGKIDNREQWLESRAELWNLTDLINELGKDAPVSMINACLVPQTEAVANDGAGSQDDTEPASTKAVQANSNEFAFSDLLHKPSGVDDWFEVIDAMTKEFYANHNKTMPTRAQAWVQLCTNPPAKYGIKPSDNEQSLTMPGTIKPFNKRSFNRRWGKYTAKSNPFKSN